MKKIYFCFFVLLHCSIIHCQTDKTILAFYKSIDYEKKAEYSAAIECLLNLADSLSYDVNARIGFLYYKSGNFQNSINYYKKAISIKPNSIEPRYGYGFPAYSLKDLNGLIEQDKKILEIDPNHKTTNENLGQLYYYNNDYANALLYFEKVMVLYPFDYQNNLYLAWSNLHLGKDAEAEKYLKFVLLYSPKDQSAMDALSYLKKKIPTNEKPYSSFLKSYELSENSDYKGAAIALNEAYDKSNYVINLRLGWLYYLAGLHIESLNYYKIAVDLMPNAIEPKFGAIFPTTILGNKNDLLNYYQSILKLDPQNTYVHYKLGVLDYDKKEYQSAVNHFEKIVTLNPSDTDGLLMLAWATLKLNKTSEAKALFNRVLCFSPNNANAILGLKSEPEK